MEFYVVLPQHLHLAAIRVAAKDALGAIELACKQQGEELPGTVAAVPASAIVFGAIQAGERQLTVERVADPRSPTEQTDTE
jgi:hypothetical protein